MPCFYFLNKIFEKSSFPTLKLRSRNLDLPPLKTITNQFGETNIEDSQHIEQNKDIFNQSEIEIGFSIFALEYMKGQTK